jgi:pimeloyl-ACP methyl ester carboxylesterase
MEEALTFQDRQGHRSAGMLTAPKAKTDRAALLCHGFLSNKNSTTNKTLTRALTEQGIATFRFDFFGQGESDGPFENITVTIALDQALAALDWMAAKGYKRIGLVGSSFGGLVAILAAAKKPDLACLALKCPVADFAEVLRLEFGEAGMEHWKTNHEIPDVTGGPAPVRLRYALYENCLGYNVYEEAAMITMPTLIVQGEKDELVPLHQSSRLMGALKGKRQLEIISGAGHGFTKGEDFKKMAALLTDWMVKHLT